MFQLNEYLNGGYIEEKENSKIMMTKNDNYDNSYSNGSMGVVKGKKIFIYLKEIQI